MGYKEDILSQKARGIAELATRFNTLAGTAIVSFPSKKIYFPSIWGPDNAASSEDEESFFNKFLEALRVRRKNGDVFLRSCPKDPRPGVLENLLVQCKPGPMPTKPALEFIKKMMELEPDGAIVIQKFFRPSVSGVIHNGIATFGLGHDGVTAGRGKTITASSIGFSTIKENVKALGYTLQDHEIEIVDNGKGWVPVQIRKSVVNDNDHGGVVPIAPGCYFGFSPHESKRILDFDFVRIVDSEHEDLSLAERIFSSYSSVLIIQRGGNPLSHWRGQALAYGFAYVAVPEDFKPGFLDSAEDYYLFITEASKNNIKISDEALPSDHGTGAKVVHKDFQDDFFVGVNLGLSLKMSTEFGKLYHDHFALWVFFMEFVNGGNINKDTALLAGVFSGVMLRLVFLLCSGEVRHAAPLFGFRGYVIPGITEALIPDIRQDGCWGSASNSFVNGFASDGFPRQSLYNAYGDHSFSGKESLATAARLLIAWEMVFRSRGWGGSMGGKKWAAICAMARSFLYSILSRKIDKVIPEGNRLLNAVHNGGWAFNKFCKPSIMTPSVVGSDDFHKTVKIALLCLSNPDGLLRCTYMLPPSRNMTTTWRKHLKDIFEYKRTKECPFHVGSHVDECATCARLRRYEMERSEFDKTLEQDPQEIQPKSKICPHCGEYEYNCNCEFCGDCNHLLSECICLDDPEPEEDEDEEEEDEETPHCDECGHDGDNCTCFNHASAPITAITYQVAIPADLFVPQKTTYDGATNTTIGVFSAETA